MEQKISNQRIDRLDINDNILNVLKENEITTLGNLCSKSKTDLKNIGLLPNESNKVEVELQLMGLNLRNSL
jgi:DNA-directed RNA polymerase alpha subunit